MALTGLPGFACFLFVAWPCLDEPLEGAMFGALQQYLPFAVPAGGAIHELAVHLRRLLAQPSEVAAGRYTCASTAVC